MTWAIVLLIGCTLLVLVGKIFYFPELINILEILISPDGVISYPEVAVKQLLIAPSLLILVLWINKKIFDIWSPPCINIKWYLFIFITHLSFYFIYIKLIATEGPKENDFLEMMTFFLAFWSGVFFTISGLLKLRVALLIGICFFIFAFEEISWGQSLLKFDSPTFFKTHNYQQETNLHNFLNPVLTSPLSYMLFNLLLLCVLTCFTKFTIFSKFYKLQSVSFIVEVSNRHSIWIAPCILMVASIFPGLEFVEQQWSIIGFWFSLILLVEVIKSRQ